VNVYIKSIAIGLACALFTYFFLERIFNKDKSTEERLKEQAQKEYSAWIKFKPDAIDAAAKNSTIQNLKKRCEKLDPQFQLEDNAGIYTLKLKGLDDTTGFTDALFSSSSLGFYEVYTLSELAPVIRSVMEITKQRSEDTASRGDLLQELVTPPEEDNRNIFHWVSQSLDGGPELGHIASVKNEDTSYIDSFFNQPAVREGLPANAEIMTGKGDGGHRYVYAIRKGTLQWPLDEKRVKDAEAGFNAFNNHPNVRLQFDAAGARIFEELTRKNIERPIAIVSGRTVLTAPRVSEPISGGSIEINGDFRFYEASLMAMQLSAGAMPSKISILEVKFQPVKKPSGRNYSLWGTAIGFLLFSALAYFIFRREKPLKTR
jgi:hypothetical protein